MIKSLLNISKAWQVRCQYALTTAIAESGFLELPLNIKHVNEVHQLPILHKDPFDRILIAQAMSEPLRFLTADEKLKEYSELVEIV